MMRGGCISEEREAVFESVGWIRRQRIRIHIGV